MNTYIALLRGINVSGQKLIKMELLRKTLTELDFSHISTYIQSGNILFRSAISDSKKLEKQIHDLIERHFGFDVPVIVVTPGQLQSVIQKNPYAAENIAEPQPYVAFLSGIPEKTDVEILKGIDFQKDRFSIVGDTIYLHYADGAGSTKLSNAVIEKKLKLTATSRNWKTVKKLVELAGAMPE